MILYADEAAPLAATAWWWSRDSFFVCGTAAAALSMAFQTPQLVPEN